MVFQFNPLPAGFVLAKPIQWGEYDENEIYELEKSGNLIIEIKKDGWKLFAIKNGNDIKIYTDGAREITAAIPHIANELAMRKLPENTFLVGEGFIVANGRDDRGKVQGVLAPAISAEKSLAAQKIFKLQFMVFDAVFMNGKYLLETPYAERLGLITDFFKKDGYVCPAAVLTKTFDDAKKLAVKNGWEGLVLYDKNFRSSFRLDGGNPKRPDGCYKWKPMYEGDFLVRDATMSKDQKTFKEVFLLQIDPETGAEIDCGKHGTFSAGDRAEIREILKTKGPAVLQFEYEQRTKNNKLVNKRFLSIRRDKKWQDCLLPATAIPKNI